MNQVSVFLSHSSKDKPFVRNLADKLRNHNVKVWLDEAEINIGDSLVKKISVAVNDVDYLLVVLSENSIRSKWVYEELEMAFSDQLKIDENKILPILKDIVEIPSQLKYLSGKRYADFTNEVNFARDFPILLRSIGAKSFDTINNSQITIYINIVHEQTSYWKNMLRDSISDYYVLFDEKYIKFENGEAKIETILGKHKLEFCVEYYLFNGRTSQLITKKATTTETSFTEGSYYYMCFIVQIGGLLDIFRNTNPLIKLMRHQPLSL